MKLRRLWLVGAGMLVSTIASALSSAVDAYREGHYFQASSALVRETSRDGAADYYLARMFLYGYGELKNDAVALRYLNQSAEHGYLPAINMAARVALVKENDPVRALYWFKKAAEANDLSAQLYCAAAYHVGLGTPVNEDQSRRYLILAARLGNARAQYALAEHFLAARDKASQSLAVVWLNKALEKQYVPAAVKLSELYSSGRGVSPDAEKAKNLLDWVAARKANEQPKRVAEMIPSEVTPHEAAARWLSDNRATTLTACGYDVHGILRDWQNPQALLQNNYNQAPQMARFSRDALFNPHFEMMDPNHVSLIDYYRAFLQSSAQGPEKTVNFPSYPVTLNTVNLQVIQKAVLGDSTVQFQLGQAYQQGVGVTKNMQQAISYYKKAAAQLELRAEYNLGLIYLQGLAGKPDYPAALGWLTHAAFKGNAYAQYALGQIWENGYPIPSIPGEPSIEPDHEQALSMYYLAASNHEPGAQYRLANLLVREPDSSLTVAVKQKRDALIRSLYEGAAANGQAEAQLPLAFFKAMDANASEQNAAFELANSQASTDNPAAALLLGLLYDRGIGVATSHPKAMIWYQKAGSNPSVDFILGTYLAQGNGVAKDSARAHTLLAQATQAGFYYAPLNLAVLEQQQQQPFLDNLLKAHQAGNNKASLLLADYYLTYNNHVSQLQQARAIYQELAQKGNAEGQVKFAYLLEHGLGGAQNSAQAAAWYEQAANQGQSIAQYRLARLQQLGLVNGKPDYLQAKKWYMAARAHFAPAAIALGFIDETVDDNYHQAWQNYTLAAERNDPVGQFNLALMLEQGKGMPVDARRAEGLYLAAANQGHTQAMVQLAGLYLTGQLGARDESNALFWLKKAAGQNDRGALYQLGLLSETGIAMPLDYSEALRFYQAAANRGNDNASLALARFYQYGFGVSKDTMKAAELYKALAALGNATAAYQLALLTYEGALGEPNQQDTRRWLTLASNNGNQQAVRRLQWLNAQTDSNVSFIEPLEWTGRQTAANESAHWIYLNVVREWNQGNERNSRLLLSQLLQEYPNYDPAKQAYTHLQEQSGWEQSRL